MSTKKNIKEIMSKRYIQIGILIVLISLVGLASTYAWFTWKSSSNTNVTLSIGNLADVTFTSGPDINISNLAPVYNYTDGVSTTFVMKNNSTTNNLNYEIKLDVTSISNELKNESFKYTLLKDNKVVQTGNLKNAVNGKTLTLNTGLLAKGSTSNYKLYFWIDGNIENSSSMMNKSLVGMIDVGEKTTYINNLYNNSTKTPVTNNSITYQYDTKNNLMQDTAGNIRYYGASPNNYIYFNCDSYPSTNCELWRIIGVFDGKIKLMRNKSIGDMAYDDDRHDTYLQQLTSNDNNSAVKMLQYDNDSEVTAKLLAVPDSGDGQNDYSSSSLQKILNNYYYNKLNYTGTITYDFTNTGIKNDTTRNMIAETTWNLGGWDTSNIYSNVMYEKERGTTVISNPSDGITRTTTWTGKIALAYPSDYGFATDLSKCSQTLSNYDSSTDSYACRNNDWMYSIITNSGSGYGWLLTLSSSDAYVAFNVNSDGYVGSHNDVINYVYIEYGVAPVLYLCSDQDIVAGDGSQSNPYKLTGN